MHELISLWMSWVQDWGYAGVIVLMAMESSIFPVPSEVVIPPAAILSTQDGASMSFWGVVVAGTFGSWLGSAITYAVARIVGRPVIMRWGKFFFMPPNKVEKAEVFLQRYEVSGVFFARLLPVIRHLISIPAGIVRMGFGVFSLVTVLGAFVWCTVLAWYGHRIGERHPELLKSPEELMGGGGCRNVRLLAGIRHYLRRSPYRGAPGHHALGQILFHAAQQGGKGGSLPPAV